MPQNFPSRRLLKLEILRFSSELLRCEVELSFNSTTTLVQALHVQQKAGDCFSPMYNLYMVILLSKIAFTCSPKKHCNYQSLQSATRLLRFPKCLDLEGACTFLNSKIMTSNVRGIGLGFIVSNFC